MSTIRIYACWEDAVNKDGEFFDAVRYSDYEALAIERDTALTANITLREQQRASNERIVELEELLHRIADWCAAYPLEVFPEPNLQADKELLGDAEFTRLNVHSMRHVVEGIAKIAKQSAAPTDPTVPLTPPAPSSRRRRRHD